MSAPAVQTIGSSVPDAPCAPLGHSKLGNGYADGVPSSGAPAGNLDRVRVQNAVDTCGGLPGHDRSCGDTQDDRAAKRPRQGGASERFFQDNELPSHCIRGGVPAETSTNSFRVPDRPSPPEREDDKDGHYRYEPGENFSSRYKILSKMGEGTFGRVLECWDRKRKDYVAIKIVRNVQKYRDAAMIELEVLNTILINDSRCRWHCVALWEWFTYRGHVCMVFEKLGPSLYDFLRKNRYKPFPLHYIQSFALQLIESVAYLHHLSLVHTDLKPENILLANNQYNKVTGNSRLGKRLPATDEIKLIDFGSATFEDQYHSTIVSTRHYRAPEVILGLGWSYPCDMWSIGCILVEFITGDALFQTHENMEHLAMMEAVLGPLPESMTSKANKHAAKYFYKARLDWPGGAPSRDSLRVVSRMRKLSSIIAEGGELPSYPALLPPLLELVQGLLQYEPEKRLTAEEALTHPFFSEANSAAIQKSRSDFAVAGLDGEP